MINGRAQAFALRREPSRKAAAQREDLFRGLRVEKFGAGVERSRIGRSIRTEEGRFAVPTAAIPHHGARPRGSAHRKGTEGKSSGAQPCFTLGAGCAASETKRGIRNTETEEHFRNVDALASDLKRLAA